MQHKLIQSTFRFIFLILLAATSLYVFFKISSLIYPFIIAFILAYLINPLVNLLEKKAKLPRSFAVILSLIVMIGVIGGLLTFFISEIINGTQFLIEVVPNYFQSLVHYCEIFITEKIIPIYETLLSHFNELDKSNQITIMNNIQNLGDTITNWGTQLMTGFLVGISSFISHLPTTVTVFVISLLATFFISKDWNKLHHIKNEKLPAKIKYMWATVFHELRIALVGFIKAQFTLITMTTIIVLIGLVLLQVPYAVTISLIIGIVDLLPYLGTGFILVPWIVYSFIAGNSKFAIALAILYAIVLVQRQIMEPKVISSNIGVDPLATLVAVFVGFQLFGFLGLILGPIILVIINTLHKANVFHHIWKFITET